MTTTDEKQISRRAIAKGVAWAAPTAVVASALPAYATSSPNGGQGGLCWTAQSGTTVNNANMFLYLFVGASEAIPAGAGSWTYTVTVKYANNTDFNTFTNPLKMSYGAFNGSMTQCAADAATRTRTYTITFTNSDALPAGHRTCQPYIYTGNNSGIKPSTQITVTSKESGVTNSVLYNQPNSTWGCTPQYTSVPTAPPQSGCCYYSSSGRANTGQAPNCATGTPSC